MDYCDISSAASRGTSEEVDLRNLLRSANVVPGLVSVIIPVYQGERFILGAVRSALQQTYTNLEVLVVDDGSTDSTAAQLAGVVDSRVSILRQENRGLSTARNLALAHASGEYIAFLDADDRWFPEKLEIDLYTLKASANPVAIAYSWYYAVDDQGRLLHRSRPYKFSGSVFQTMLRMDDLILPSASIFHRRVFEQLGGFDVHSYHEDRVLFLRAAKVFPIWPTRRYLAVYRQSLEGKGRRILMEFMQARLETLSIVDRLEGILSRDESAVLRSHQLRSLYCRFLMYGFNSCAARILPEVDVQSLRHGAKGWLAWLHAKTGVNLMCPVRLLVQRTNRTCGQRRWRKMLLVRGLDLKYGAD